MKKLFSLICAGILGLAGANAAPMGSPARASLGSSIARGALGAYIKEKGETLGLDPIYVVDEDADPEYKKAIAELQTRLAALRKQADELAGKLPGIDDDPAAGSGNFVRSGGVANALSDLLKPDPTTPADAGKFLKYDQALPKWESMGATVQDGDINEVIQSGNGNAVTSLVLSDGGTNKTLTVNKGTTFYTGSASDLLPKSGGTITGTLSSSVAPTEDLHMANREYVDKDMVSSESYSITKPHQWPDGTIIYFGSALYGLRLTGGSRWTSNPLNLCVITRLVEGFSTSSSPEIFAGGGWFGHYSGYPGTTGYNVILPSSPTQTGVLWGQWNGESEMNSGYFQLKDSKLELVVEAGAPRADTSYSVWVLYRNFIKKSGCTTCTTIDDCPSDCIERSTSETVSGAQFVNENCANNSTYTCVGSGGQLMSNLECSCGDGYIIGSAPCKGRTFTVTLECGGINDSAGIPKNCGVIQATYYNSDKPNTETPHPLSGKQLDENQWKFENYTFLGYADAVNKEPTNIPTQNLYINNVGEGAKHYDKFDAATFYGYYSYTVSYDKNGGESDTPAATCYVIGASPKDCSLSDGSSLSRTGHAFDGWSTRRNGADPTPEETAGGVKVYGDNVANYTDGPQALYARWKLTATYDVGGAAGTAPTEQTAYANGSTDAKINLATCSNLVKTGHYCNSWTVTIDDGDPKTYKETATFTAGEYSPDGNVNFVANWEPDSKILSFFCEGNDVSGSPSPSNQKKVNYGSEQAMGVNDIGVTGCKKTGHSLIGWATSKDQTEAPAHMVTGDQAFYPVFAPNKITVKYNKNGGLGSDPVFSQFAYGNANTGKAPANTYTYSSGSTIKEFISWKVCAGDKTSDANCTAIQEDYDSVIPGGGISMAAGDNTTITLVANWGQCVPCDVGSGASCHLSAPLGVCTYATGCIASSSSQAWHTLSNSGKYNPSCTACSNKPDAASYTGNASGSNTWCPWSMICLSGKYFKSEDSICVDCASGYACSGANVTHATSGDVGKSPKIFAVTFYGDGSSGVAHSIYYLEYDIGWYDNSNKIGGTVSQMQSAPSKNGCTLSGWFTAATGGTELIEPDGSFVGKNTIFNNCDGNACSLYAQWECGI